MEGREFKCEKRRTEFALGRFLLKYVLEHHYNIEKPKIILKNKKPVLENNELFFSLSHTKNIVLAAFDDVPVGIDIEVMKERNFDMIYRFWKKTQESVDKKTFYKLWTEYEAQVKLQQESESKYNAEIFENYMLGICSANPEPIAGRLELFALNPPSETPNVNKYPLSLLKNPQACSFLYN